MLTIVIKVSILDVCWSPDYTSETYQRSEEREVFVGERHFIYESK